MVNETFVHYGNKLIRTLYGRLNTYGGFMILICGGTGTGKTYSGISLGEVLDPNFLINKEGKSNLTFRISELSEKLNDREAYPPGSVIIYDEPGVSANSRTWYDAVQIAVSRSLQIARERKLIIIFCTPDASYIDSQLRKLFTYYFETKYLRKGESLCVLSPKRIIIDRKTGKIYFYNIKIDDGDEGIVTIKELLVKKPSRENYKPYEDMKQEFNDIIHHETYNKAIAAEGMLGRQKIEKYKGLTEEEAKLFELVVRGYTPKKIAEIANINPQDISRIKSRIKAKGYPVPMSGKERLLQLRDKDIPTEPDFEKPANI